MTRGDLTDDVTQEERWLSDEDEEDSKEMPMEMDPFSLREQCDSDIDRDSEEEIISTIDDVAAKDGEVGDDHGDDDGEEQVQRQHPKFTMVGDTECEITSIDIFSQSGHLKRQVDTEEVKHTKPVQFTSKQWEDDVCGKKRKLSTDCNAVQAESEISFPLSV